MEKKTVKLKYPIKRAGEPDIKELTLREPKAKELKLMDKRSREPIAGSLAVIAQICEQGLTPEEIDDLCATDTMALVDELGKWISPDGV